MKKNIVLFYLLMLLVVMGAFASMALNAYGVTLMSYAALGFGTVLLYELVLRLPGQTSITPLDARMIALELLSLSTLCFVYAAHGLMINVPLSEEMKYILASLLLGVNIFHLLRTNKEVKDGPVAYRVGLLMYFISLILLNVAANVEGAMIIYLSPVAFACLIVFVVLGWRKVVIEGEETSAIQHVRRLKNKSGLQLVGFGLMIGYFSLNALHLLPSLYFGSMPNGYAKVATRQLGNTKSPDPKAFEEAYRKFIKGK